MDGKLIAKIRFTYRLTQQELADKLGVSKSYISLVEKNKTKLSEKTRQKLNNLFDMGLIKEKKLSTWREDLDLTDSEGEELLKIVKENKPLLFLILNAINGDKRCMQAVKNLFDEVGD